MSNLEHWSHETWIEKLHAWSGEGSSDYKAEIITDKEWCESMVRIDDEEIGVNMTTKLNWGGVWFLSPFYIEVGEGSFDRIFMSNRGDWLPEFAIFELDGDLLEIPV